MKFLVQSVRFVAAAPFFVVAILTFVICANLLGLAGYIVDGAIGRRELIRAAFYRS